MSRNSKTSTRNGSTGRRRAAAVLALVLTVAGLGTMAPSAGALPYNDPYDDVSPTTTRPLADLAVSVRFAAVYHYSTGAWEGSRAIVTVKNVGDRMAGSSSLRVYAEQRDEWGYYMVRSLTHNIPGLGPGSSVTVESLYFRRYCTVELTATADAGRAVPEGNESNNVVHVDLARCAR